MDLTRAEVLLLTTVVMSACGTSRTSQLHRRMSVVGGKADMTQTLDNVG